MKRDIAGFLRERLTYFQGFEQVRVYYDSGQVIVRSALYDAVYEVLAKQAVVKRRTTMTEYRLSQAADYLCTIELAAAKYAARCPLNPRVHAGVLSFCLKPSVNAS